MTYTSRVTYHSISIGGIKEGALTSNEQSIGDLTEKLLEGFY